MKVLPPFLPHQVSDPTHDHTEIPSDDPARESSLPFFLFAGRLERIKGLQDVIPSFKNLSSAELWIAGSGTYEPVLRNLAKDSKNIRFLGTVPPEKMSDLYRRAIALIVPSISYEVFPMVLLESFREGTPVIARRLGPLPEVIKESGGGLLFSDRQSLESALKDMASNQAMRSSFGRAAREAFEERWSEKSFLHRYFALISTIAKRKGLHHLAELGAPAPGVEQLQSSVGEESL
jgi:glycosyltransferase involved in cell wall biosynthesis